MEIHETLLSIGLLLIVAKLLEGIFKRFGLNSIIAYATAGVILGPATGLVKSGAEIEIVLNAQGHEISFKERPAGATSAASPLPVYADCPVYSHHGALWIRELSSWAVFVGRFALKVDRMFPNNLAALRATSRERLCECQ